MGGWGGGGKGWGWRWDGGLGDEVRVLSALYSSVGYSENGHVTLINLKFVSSMNDVAEVLLVDLISIHISSLIMRKEREVTEG